ncbi:MAG: 50S ribosomal protein L20 [Dehalococcoidia bacterium]|nr:50S ribosomal protein L20 [Dehalococcoidia bacterium]
MARVKRGVTKHRRHKAVLTAAKGYYGARRRHYKVAKEQVLHSLVYAFAHRRERKADMRKLWIVRISAACRAAGMSYSQFMNGLTRAQIDVNRKVLAELAVNQPTNFIQLVEKAKAALPAA